MGKIKMLKLDGIEYAFLRYKDKWVLPIFESYENGLGTPIAMTLYTVKDGIIDYYTTVTVNPECKRNAGCQFIDTNNNDADIVDWLEENQFGKRTDNKAVSGFCTYPEFDFYKGKRFWEYRYVTI